MGTLSSSNDGVLTITGQKLVDNAFAVPGAENCGPGGIFDEILDLDKGLPSAAGNNNAVLWKFLHGSGVAHPQVPRLIRCW